MQEKEQKEPWLGDIRHASNRIEPFKNVMYKCGHNKPRSISKFQMDAVLLNVIDELFQDEVIEHDVALMALGLLQGYEYTSFPAIGLREERFLKYTNYLVIRSGGVDKAEDYNSADIDGKRRLMNNLGKIEANVLEKIEKHLLLRGNIENYIAEAEKKVEKDGKGKIICPKPLYPKCEGIELNSIGGISIELKEVKRYLYKLCEKAGILKPPKNGIKGKIAKGVKIATTATTMVIAVGAISFGVFWVWEQSGSDTSYDPQDSPPIAKVPTSHMKIDNENESTTGGTWINNSHLKSDEIFDNTTQLTRSYLFVDEDNLKKY